MMRLQKMAKDDREDEGKALLLWGPKVATDLEFELEFLAFRPSWRGYIALNCFRGSGSWFALFNNASCPTLQPIRVEIPSGPSGHNWVPLLYNQPGAALLRFIRCHRLDPIILQCLVLDAIGRIDSGHVMATVLLAESGRLSQLYSGLLHCHKSIDWRVVIAFAISPQTPLWASRSVCLPNRV